MTRSRRGALYPPGPVHIHILGICGTFMGGIAAIAQTAGYRVTGCDANVYPPMSTQLLAQGIELTEGYGADQLALKPDLWLIGNVAQNFGISARLGNKVHFVIEADEYDTAFFDKRSKMVHYRPRVAILSNIEFDHADIFVDLTAIETQFHNFVRTIPSFGQLIVNGADPAIERVLTRGCWTPVERFGVKEGWRASEVARGCFDVLYQETPVGQLCWELLVEHNRSNALAAIAAARAAGVEPARAVQSLARFKNVRRRMELRGTAAGVAVWDDFAHHPTAIATTLAGLRDQVGNARILAVLEPRSNTMKAGA